MTVVRSKFLCRPISRLRRRHVAIFSNDNEINFCASVPMSACPSVCARVTQARAALESSKQETCQNVFHEWRSMSIGRNSNFKFMEFLEMMMMMISAARAHAHTHKHVSANKELEQSAARKMTVVC